MGSAKKVGGGSTRVAMTPRDGTRRMAVLEKWEGRMEGGGGGGNIPSLRRLTVKLESKNAPLHQQ